MGNRSLFDPLMLESLNRLLNLTSDKVEGVFQANGLKFTVSNADKQKVIEQTNFDLLIHLITNAKEGRLSTERTIEQFILNSLLEKLSVLPSADMFQDGASDLFAASSSHYVVPLEEKFSLCNTITPADVELKITSQAQVGDTLTAKAGQNISQVQLTKELAMGGEGKVFYTDIEDTVAKIYFANKVSSATYEKLKLLCSKPIQHEGICFPSALLYNQNDEFVGFLMPEAKGKALSSSVLAPSYLKRQFPNWEKIDLVKLCLTILEKINYLHDRNILIGDINPHNILVESPTEVYFLGTDSYQIEGYPCPVGSIEFTAPELQNKHLSELLRTVGNENFAIAILMFKILMLGKHPYHIQNGDLIVNNICNGVFVYRPNMQTQGNIPDGPWFFLWSHLPAHIQEAFYQTFNKQGLNYEEHLRLNSHAWQVKLQKYLDMFADGSLESQDAMSLSALPTRCKHESNSYSQWEEL